MNSAGEETIAKTIYDTGIYTLDTPVEAKKIIIRRVESGGQEEVLWISHMRAYQSTNLMLSATVHY